MSKMHWALVVVVLGGGVLLQIPRHDPHAADGHDHPELEAGTANRSDGGISPTDIPGPGVTVKLAVSGMT